MAINNSDPSGLQWTFHPASATNPEAYYSGTMEVGATTINLIMVKH